ncbi:hypothetical protein HMPREF9104_00755 [Lentilactobacillus kisonensis F0435]|uniref:Uncharacterized protein n=1 Tax=Lentilactobacillus kisonensis F0435 TaxID=797516 RepID=H1LDT0_9LACO|nr:hypothetical protein HMPREF9104_00755 [Lentilactobacillus kisonensis F0435]
MNVSGIRALWRSHLRRLGPLCYAHFTRTAVFGRNFHISTLVKNPQTQDFCPRRLIFRLP